MQIQLFQINVAIANSRQNEQKSLRYLNNI